MSSHDADLPAAGDPAPALLSDTAVQHVAPGSYRGHMHPSWWIIDGPNGGYVAAVVLRAMIAEVSDPQRRPRSLTVHYLRAPAEGPVQVDVTVERRGRTVTNLSARLSQAGRTMALALAALAVPRHAPVEFDEAPGLPTSDDGAAIPLPEQIALAPVDPSRDVPMRKHYDMRWALGDRPFMPSSAARARSGGWLRPADPVPVDEVVLAAMSDAWLPPIFSRFDQPLAVPTIDLTVHFRALPTDPLDFCFVEFDSPVARDGYLVEHGRLLDRRGVLLAESRQLAVVA